MSRINALLFIILLGGINAAALAAGYYTWTDANGVTHFTDRPPAQAQENVTQGVVDVPEMLDAPGYRLPSWGDVKDRPTHEPRARQKKVVIYTTTRCGYCKKAKAYMNAKGIRYTEYDVETSSKGRQDYKRMRGTGVPIILVGKQRMNGYSQARLDKLLLN